MMSNSKMVDIFPHTQGGDMFPCCADIHGIVSTHVETVVCLRREKIDGYVGIDLDIDKVCGNHGSASYTEIQAYIKEKYGLNISSLYIGQVKDRCGIKERANYNHGSGNGRVPNCPPEKEKAILDAFRHFHMIEAD